MNILLILLKINSDCQWHVGLANISAVLKEKGYNVALFEMNNYTQDKRCLLDKISQYKPDVIGISANSHQFRYIGSLAADIKSFFHAPVFVGGVHTTLTPDSIGDIKELDGICIGEGELPFLELVNRIAAKKDYFDVENFWFRKDTKIVMNKMGRLIENLDTLPYPDRSIFAYFKSATGKVVPRFIFSRGCPFECSYCCNHAFKKIYTGLGKYVRRRSVEKALAEIELEKNRYNFTCFKLDDDTFSLDKTWMMEFCNKLSKTRWGLTFECNVRPGTIDEEGMEFLKKAGCNMIKIGIETGDENLRWQILNRHFTDENIIKTFNLAKRFNIRTFSFNMIGVPGETPETVRATVDLNTKIRPDRMQVTAFYPYPHTILGELCQERGYIERDHEDSYMKKSTLKLPTISKKQIEKFVKNFKFLVYWRYDKRIALIEKWLQFRESFLSNKFFHYFLKRIYKLVILLKN